MFKTKTFRWIYLEPIFGSGTLEHEKGRFYRLDRDFRGLTKFVESDSRVCALCRYLNLRAILDNLLDQLSRCQNSLDTFLTVIKLCFLLIPIKANLATGKEEQVSPISVSGRRRLVGNRRAIVQRKHNSKPLEEAIFGDSQHQLGRQREVY